MKNKYCHFLGQNAPERNSSIESETESDTDPSEADISELILVPSDPVAINSLYEALKQCQLLNPDPEDMDEEDEDSFIYEDADDTIPIDHANNLDHYGDGDTGNKTFEKIFKILKPKIIVRSIPLNVKPHAMQICLKIFVS